ncbi:hypothetical protein [Natronoglycomyces albus]|nr:hypothetical protein [Natronoglycomyces albus]
MVPPKITYFSCVLNAVIIYPADSTRCHRDVLDMTVLTKPVSSLL